MKLKERFIEWFTSLFFVRWFLDAFCMLLSVIFVIFFWRVTQRIIDHRERVRLLSHFGQPDPFAYERTVLKFNERCNGMKEQPTKELTGRNLSELLGALNWGADFTVFCSHLALEPGSSVAREKWRQFQLLCNGAAAFDVENMQKLINLAQYLQAKNDA